MRFEEGQQVDAHPRFRNYLDVLPIHHGDHLGPNCVLGHLLQVVDLRLREDVACRSEWTRRPDDARGAGANLLTVEDGADGEGLAEASAEQQQKEFLTGHGQAALLTPNLAEHERSEPGGSDMGCIEHVVSASFPQDEDRVFCSL
jgi:hypothetical protein